MKALNLRITLVVISVLALLLSPAATGYAKATSNMAVEAAVSSSSSFEDANWPIIKTEEIVVKSPSTGEEVVTTAVTRQGPSECGQKKDTLTDTIALPAATCTFQYSTTYSNSAAAGGVTGYVKVFADKYCGTDGDCAFNKMTKIQAWWKRTGTGWVVRSAYMRWGCANGFCNKCPDNGPITPGTRQSSTFTPAWNGLTSQTYYLTYSSWPIMKSNGYGQVIGFSHGVVESPSHTTQTLDVWVILPGP